MKLVISINLVAERKNDPKGITKEAVEEYALNLAERFNREFEPAERFTVSVIVHADEHRGFQVISRPAEAMFDREK